MSVPCGRQPVGWKLWSERVMGDREEVMIVCAVHCWCLGDVLLSVFVVCVCPWREWRLMG